LKIKAIIPWPTITFILHLYGGSGDLPPEPGYGGDSSHDLKKEGRGRRKWNKEISKEEGDKIFLKKIKKNLTAF
jgi:hypothetical protein